MWVYKHAVFLGGILCRNIICSWASWASLHMASGRRQVVDETGRGVELWGTASVEDLDHKEGWALKSWCFRIVVLEKTLEHPLDSKEIKPVNPKGSQPWIFIVRTDAEADTLILWPLDAKSRFIGKDWCWAKLKAGGEGDDRGRDGWMASPTRWTWVWASSGSWWWTGKPGVLQSMGLPRVGQDWATELNL